MVLLFSDDQPSTDLGCRPNAIRCAGLAQKFEARLDRTLLVLLDRFPARTLLIDHGIRRWFDSRRAL